MTNQCFDIAYIRHASQHRDGITYLDLMSGVQFQQLLNGLSRPVDTVYRRI